MSIVKNNFVNWAFKRFFAGCGSLLVVLMIWYVSTLPSFGNDFKKGLLAYSNGEWSIALDKWSEIAKKGNANWNPDRNGD